ncbi:MAG: glycosyltransferase family 2 protein [Candidatus Shapirobacteria bacterium]
MNNHLFIKNFTTMESNKIIFSVISVNFNGGNKFIESIKSVANQNYPDLEIIVIDNGSKDGSIEKLENLNIKNIKICKLPKNLGFTAGSNLGVEKSSGKYFLVLNNDAYLDKTSFIQESIDILEKSNNNTIGIFPKIIFNWEQNVINTTYVKWHYRQLWYDDQIGRIDFSKKEKNKEVFGTMFVAPIFKKELWLKIGGFDNTFFTYGEDFDISYRANVLGYKFLYCPSIKVRHDFRSSSKDDSNPLWAYFYFQRNYLYVIIKNYQFSSLIKCYKYYSAIFRNSFKSGIKNKDFKLIKLHIKVVRDLIINLPHLLKERKIIQKYRKVRDADIWNYDFTTNFNPYFYNNKIVLNISNINE